MLGFIVYQSRVCLVVRHVTFFRGVLPISVYRNQRHFRESTSNASLLIVFDCLHLALLCGRKLREILRLVAPDLTEINWLYTIDKNGVSSRKSW